MMTHPQLLSNSQFGEPLMAAALDLAFSTWSTTTSPSAVAVSQILDRRSRLQPGSRPRPRAAGTHEPPVPT